MWLYFLAYLFVVGMAINVDYYSKGRYLNNEEEGKIKKETK